MNLIKDDRTLRLDNFELSATEALGLCNDLEEHIDDPALRALLAKHVAAQTELLRQVEHVRRARGELPQAGDPERAHLGAAGAYLRAVVLPGDATTHYAESLHAAAAKVSTALEEALAIEHDTTLARLLSEFQGANEDFVAALSRFE
jgi:hypothetical protein